ncbi:hypothetical protein P5P86_14190 [Nocardioides sp. BP30]|uniref:hypothetical protein n=1 Tax=Nocardioides sp. BP30 TaxID=3036374 RepID=UPI00246844DA|nr:hypothetical protein [Nocardioides sp. BP30]WGL51107.1 hypothetical protein P5P86_14190 [Nocardioides sp. BP30]
MARHGSSSRRSSRRLHALAAGALLVAGTALSGCGGSSSDGNGDAASGSAAVSASGTATSAGGYPTGVPTGITLTSPGTALQLGQAATVAWQPTQKLVGVLDVTVTAVHSTTLRKSFKGWELDEATKQTAPYFVTATVRNAGRSDLAGAAVPLYGSAASGALVEASTFATDFKPCSPGILPTPFPAGASAQVCLVYLVPAAGTLKGVSFRPTEAFAPIAWTGAVTPLGKGGSSGATGSPSVAPSGVPSGLPSGSTTASPAPAGSPDVHMSGSPLR